MVQKFTTKNKATAIVFVLALCAALFGTLWLYRQTMVKATKTVLRPSPPEQTFGKPLYLGNMVAYVSNPTIVFNGDQAELHVKVLVKAVPVITDHIDPTCFIVQTTAGKLFLPTNAVDILGIFKDDPETGGFTTEFYPHQQNASVDKYTRTIFKHTLIYQVPLKDIPTCRVLLTNSADFDGHKFITNDKVKEFAAFTN